MTATRGSEAFHALLRDIGELHDKKQADYGSDADPFANVRSASDWGLPGSLGACIRITDKLRRLQTYYRKRELANESVEDAYMDLAVYALIGLVLLREETAAEVPAENDAMPERRCLRCFGAGTVAVLGGDETCAFCGGSGVMPERRSASESLRRELQGDA